MGGQVASFMMISGVERGGLVGRGCATDVHLRMRRQQHCHHACRNIDCNYS